MPRHCASVSRTHRHTGSRSHTRPRRTTRGMSEQAVEDAAGADDRDGPTMEGRDGAAAEVDALRNEGHRRHVSRVPPSLRALRTDRVHAGRQCLPSNAAPKPRQTPPKAGPPMRAPKGKATDACEVGAWR